MSALNFLNLGQAGRSRRAHNRHIASDPGVKDPASPTCEKPHKQPWVSESFVADCQMERFISEFMRSSAIYRTHNPSTWLIPELCYETNNEIDGYRVFIGQSERLWPWGLIYPVITSPYDCSLSDIITRMKWKDYVMSVLIKWPIS